MISKSHLSKTVTYFYLFERQTDPIYWLSSEMSAVSGAARQKQGAGNPIHSLIGKARIGVSRVYVNKKLETLVEHSKVGT